MIILSGTTKLTVDDLIIYMAIVILAFALYYYSKYGMLDDPENEDEERERRLARKKAMQFVLLFLLYAVAVHMIEINGWVGQVGAEAEAYFETFARQLVAENDTPEDPSWIDLALGSVQTVGLIVYVLIVSTIAVLGAAPPKRSARTSVPDSGTVILRP